MVSATIYVYALFLLAMFFARFVDMYVGGKSGKNANVLHHNFKCYGMIRAQPKAQNAIHDSYVFINAKLFVGCIAKVYPVFATINSE